MTPSEFYLQLGWAPVRLRTLSKAPYDHDWPNIDYRPADFGPADNVGIKLGDPSGGLVDVDLDCPEAVELAPRFLPGPTLTFGRASKPRGHWLYVAPGLATWRPKRVGVELRSTGLQTMAPGSVHDTTGEEIVWCDQVAPLAVDPTQLRAAFARLALATKIAQLTPPLQGARGMHDFILALAGGLRTSGWTLEATLALVEKAIGFAGHEHRDGAIRSTWEVEQHTGWPTVRELVGPPDEKVLRKLAEDESLGFARPTVQAVVGEEAGYPTNDSGNADRLITKHGEEIRYAPGIGWLRWDGRRWAEGDGPWPEAEEIAREIQAQGFALGGPPGKALADWGRQSGNVGRIRGTLDVASHRSEIQVDAEDLDADPWAFCCANGTLDLRTGELRPHAREDLITKISPVVFDPRATCPRFAQFLTEIFPADAGHMLSYVLRFLGSALTGFPADRCFQVWHGSGANGKSTLIETLRFVFGDYARQLAIGLLLESSRTRNSAAASPDLVALRGVRFASAVETDAGMRWNESVIKQLTGGDRVTARALYKEQIEFTSTWTLALATNHKPIVRGQDAAIWDRIHLVPFEARFELEQQDRELGKTLRREGAGILTMLVAACQAWQAEGLAPPEQVRAAVADYRSSMDVVGQFLRECCEVHPEAFVPRKALFAAYKFWATEAGEYLHGKQAFHRILEERGLRSRKPSSRSEEWVGVRLVHGA